VLDAGARDGLLWYVMPYLEGESLRKRLARPRPFPVREAVRIAREVAEALAFAHARGIVHRDVKPENILLGETGALLADFGIARALELGDGERLTLPGVRLGTIGYMAPEQLACEPDVDARADVYALGVVLHELLAGARARAGAEDSTERDAGLAEGASFRARPRLRDIRADVPAPLAATIERALAARREDRFADAGELLAALRRRAPPGDG
jgi:serine/threonine-protein kinase